jgi:3-deoxy-7-phosphoheptulonate synthase
MIIVMEQNATARQIANVTAGVEQLGWHVHLSQDEGQTIIGVLGDGRAIDRARFERMDGVKRLESIASPFKLASRDFRPQDTEVSLNGVRVGAEKVVVMAGPCSVESRAQILEAAHAVKEAGATVLRGGAFKPRSSPYSFQGLGVEGLKLLAEAREQTGLLVVTEVMSPEAVPLVSTYADVLQVGARNMQNFALLHAVGESQRPVVLKRGMMSTMEELLMSAEYILSHGNDRLILCERGIRTFETYTRNTLDINAVPLLKQLSHLPVLVDPSHGTGQRGLVGPVARAAIAAGADGLLIEVHPHPEEALSDGAQSLTPDGFVGLMGELRAVAQAVGRTI